jgi:RNA 2',3'-cyclic 3'-phosphodiesterase
MSNWFLALPIPAESWFAQVPPPPSDLRAFHPLDLHATIAFLGRVGEERARAAFAALDWPPGALDVSLGEVVAMGNPQRYSALSALLIDGREAVESAMSARRGAAFDAAGVPHEERPPKAHVTLARPKRDATPHARAAGLAWATGLDLRGVRLRLDRVALYGWSEDRSERLFRVVEARPL